MAGDIEQWLDALDLTKYRDAFAENEIAYGDRHRRAGARLFERGT